MEDDNNPSARNLAENLANLSKATAPFLPKFRNLRKVRDRLLVDVSDAAFDALVSRLRLYQTRRRAVQTKVHIINGDRRRAHRLLSGDLYLAETLRRRD